MATGIYHFKSLAPKLNAFCFDFDPAFLQPLQQRYQNRLAPFFAQPQHQDLLAGVYYQSEVLKPGDFYLVSYDTYPLLWLTNHNLNTYTLFADFFHALELTPHLKNKLRLHKALIMYSGFYVIGNRAREEMWHYDYRPGAQAYTLITPLFDWQPEHGHLLYHDAEGQKQRYTYKKNQAIIFGEGFYHSTEPYSLSPDLRVLVSFTFGTDTWESWDILKLNIAEQSHFYIQPCGHPVDTCRCYGRWKKRQKWRRWWR